MSSIAKNQQVHALIAQGKASQALAIARRMVQGARPDAPALDAMRAALLASGQPEQALHYAQRAAQADPASVPLQLELARAFNLLARVDEEAAVLRGVLARTPDNPDVHAFLASALERADRFDEAEAVAREGLARFPDEHQLLVRLAMAVASLGRTDEAAELYQQAMIQRPADFEIATHLAPTLQYGYPVRPERIRAAHENVGRLLELLDQAPPLPHARPAPPPPPKGPDRPLRVGFISPDLRTHSVAYFALAAIDGADPSLLTPFAYMTGFSLDALSAKIAAAAERAGGAFRHVVDQSDARILAAMREDRLDVVVELSGLTRDHRLRLMRLKPAPVVVSWCGYPSTTGVRAIDYRVVDSITDPPGSERWLVERPLRVDPCFTCYTPPEEAPPVGVREPGPDSALTFGSFNMLQKINDEVLRVWARVIRATPGSRLLIKAVALSHPSVRRELLKRMAAAGHDPARVELVPPLAGKGDHLAAYRRVDIALDTFPYAGTTTTCEALWMGVPVVTLAPDDGLHAARVGATLLTAVGHPEWIARSADAYVHVASGLAGDPDRLRDLRGTLRDRMARSTLCDRRGFSRRLAQALRGAWTAWARGG